MRYSVVIPARYHSVRLPGKPLRLIAGKPLLQHVYERARNSQAQRIIIATDDQRIVDVALQFGAEVCMTSSSHRSGTERIAEVIATGLIATDEIIVNLQGDEPLMPSACIDQVAALLHSHADADVATLSAPLQEARLITDSNVVKVVADNRGYAMYFSRAGIPFQRDDDVTMPSLLASGLYQRHIGLYAYRASYVSRYIHLPASPYETAEKLEQLRVLWHGGRIAIAVAAATPGPGVDTEHELQAAERLLVQFNSQG